MKGFIPILLLFLSGCVTNTQLPSYFEPYILPHKDGGEVHVLHYGNSRQEIELHCPWWKGYVTYGCAKTHPLEVTVTPEGEDRVDYVCYIVAEPPKDGWLKDVWDHEEAHCMGWQHEDGEWDSVFKLAKTVGK